MTSTILVIFTKPPAPGKTKTRLARTLGDQQATYLAQAFLEDTLEAFAASPMFSSVLATTGAWPHRTLPLPRPMEIWQQGQGDLGRRMERVLSRALSLTTRALIIGSDAPGLPRAFVEEAIRALRKNDAVLGPTDDGGFYLLGLRSCPPGLLAGLPWSDPTTAQATRRQLEDYGLSVASLPPWFDVDTVDDLKRLEHLLDTREISAPSTTKALEKLNRLRRSTH